jgi:hypothetical protein
MGAPGGVKADRGCDSSRSRVVNHSSDDISDKLATTWPRHSHVVVISNGGTTLPRGSRAALSSGAARFCSFLRRPAARKLATSPERTEAAGAFQHVVNSFHSSSAAAYAERSVRADAGSRLHRETHVALFAQARLALDPVPINLSCHGSV